VDESLLVGDLIDEMGQQMYFYAIIMSSKDI
jgi:hypothetical protein